MQCSLFRIYLLFFLNGFEDLFLDMHIAVCVYPETNRIYSINQKDNFTMVLNIYILDLYLTHFLDFFLSAVEVCMQQGTGAALLRQTSAVLQSTTSLKNTCAYLWQLLTDYTSAVHVILHNTLAQSLLVFLVKTCYVPEISYPILCKS